MSANREKPFVWILPEDDAVRQIAVGFELEVAHRQLQVLPEAGGWPGVRDEFEKVYKRKLEQNQNAHLVLIFDFDEDEDRPEQVLGEVPAAVKNRLFHFGAWSEPEQLRRNLRQNYETIGKQAADDCRNRQLSPMWQDEQLAHNQTELARASEILHAILFPAV